jgi:hypothetical protein
MKLRCARAQRSFANVKDTTRLDYALSGLQGKYGARIVQQARAVNATRPVLGSGWPALDVLLGGGWPLGAFSLLRGSGSCGAIQLAHAALAQAGGGVLVDACASADAASLADAGVPLTRLHVLRPRHPRESLHMLTDACRDTQVRCVVFDGLPFLRGDRNALRALPETLAALAPALRGNQAVCLLLEDDDAPWLPPAELPPHRLADPRCARVLTLRHTGWRYTRKRLVGFEVMAQVGERERGIVFEVGTEDRNADGRRKTEDRNADGRRKTADGRRPPSSVSGLPSSLP